MKIQIMKALAASSAVVGVASLALVSMMSTPACSSGFSCSSSSKCSADPPPSSATIMECNTLSSGACGSQYTALGSCAAGQQKCTSMNTTDTTATETAVQQNCTSQALDYATCCLSNPSACGAPAGDAGGGG